ncbi:RNA methyltransferase [Roseomonas mucosa]|uniref:RNA methyltransferase n=1 Tax=Roseomonas mucosa TaxID=207340 RepID=UPI002247B19E|nr:RNA methyltransferase [Roseomonas mucosa]UZO91723.1 RRNA methylase, SpoU family [Roseomonas mucosa]
MSTRGFTALGLVSPKCNANVGAALRAAACYSSDLIVLSGHRYRKQSTDTTKAWRHLPVLHNQADVFDAAPYGAVPVAVELVPGAIELPDFVHPERAYYIFGPEDGSLGDKVITRCRYVVAVPTAYCMNLAATINVVLYDRLTKRRRIQARAA